MSLSEAKQCPYCGHFHGDLCPQVKAFEYYDDGRIKRVEFFTPSDRVHPELLEAARKIVESSHDA